MGRENDVMLDYLKDNGRFADLFNGSIFGGKQVVCADDLLEGAEVYVEKHGTKDSGRKERTTRIRDIKKRLRCGGHLRVLAVENQEYVDFTMPWRHMNYDALEYGGQIREMKARNKRKKKWKDKAEYLCGLRREDKLSPVFTICLYHGKEKWDGPRCLKDMMDFGEKYEQWEDLFSDYRMNLLCLNEMTDFSKYQSPLRELFKLLSFRNDREKLEGMLDSETGLQEMDEETAEVVSIFMGVEMPVGKKKEEGKGYTYNMCEAIQEMMTDSRNEGREEGREEGRRDGIRLLIKLGKNRISREETKEAIQEEFCLKAEEAEKYLREFWE